jgi:glycyl-tRNA synthetase beta subunit
MRTIYFLLDNEGYLMSISSTSHRAENEIRLELPHDHVIFNDDYTVYKYENSQLIADEERRKRIIAEEQENRATEEDLKSIAMLELIEKMNTE